MLLEKFPDAKTFPVIVVDGMYIGGYNELSEELNKGSSQILLNE
jgi:glutaredoxin-related protein